MYHNILLSKNHRQQEALEKAISLLMALTAVDSVYFSDHLEAATNDGIIMVIISDDSPLAWDDLSATYWKVFADFPQFSFRIFDGSWVGEQLEDGNPFFAMHCNRNTLVYSTIKSVESDFTTKLKCKRFLTKATFKNDRSNHAVFILALNVKFYVNGKNYLQALYVLHQCIRWLLIAASDFLTGEYLVSQDLEVQQKHVGRFSTTLSKLFDLESIADRNLLEQLQAVCTHVQHGADAPDISLELVEMAKAKKERLGTEVHRLFGECLSRCRYEFSRSATPLVVIDESDLLQFITEIIAAAITISGLYCFGQRTERTLATSTLLNDEVIDKSHTHYYLFLIAKDYKADVIGSIVATIKEKTEGRCSVTLLLHTKKSLRQKAGDQQHFFYQVMQKGTLLFQERFAPPFVPFDELPARSLASARRYLHQRDQTKKYLMDAELIDRNGATTLKVYMLHLIVEQTCLGLLRLFLGYTPSYFSLSFLFELCEYFSPLTAEIFPRETKKDKELLKILSGSTALLRYGFDAAVAYPDYEVLRSRCSAFVERADLLAAAELLRLEQGSGF